MVKWHRSESTEMPRIIDDDISKVVVYLRRNITVEDREEDGKITTWYVYEEAEVNKEDYYQIAACLTGVQTQADINTANIDYMAMELDIDLDT